MVLQVKLGDQVGQGTIPAGLPGGAGGPAGPAAPYPGTGWEVKVLAAPDFHTLLAVIPSKMLLTQQFVQQLKDLGSGTVTLDMDDPFWTSVTLPNGQPAHYLLDWEHVWQVWQDGVVRFEFLGETVTETLADPSEQRIATVTGPGTAATLKWAMAAPPGFPSSIRYKLDAITDSFSETDVNGNLVLDTGLWNATANASRISLNPSGSARLVGSPGTTVLGTTAYDATNTLVSAQVAPIVSPDANGNSLNGSQVTQMYIQSVANSNYYALIGLSATTFYCQFRGPSGTYTQTIASATAYATAMTGNQDYQYWQISESGGQGGGSGTFYFWTSSDGANWKQQFSIRHNWDATNVGLYFSATYSVDNAEFATVTGINSNVTTSSLGGPAYYGKAIIGGVWLDLLAKAQARGTIPFITTGQLSSATDSFGNAWTDSQSVQIANGTDLFTLLGAHASMINADWIMQPGFLLQVGIPETGKITLGTDRSGTIIFRDGMDCASRVRTRARDQIANLYAVINSDGRTLTASDSTSESEYGQREAWLQAGMQVTEADLAAVATAADLATATEVLSWTLQVSPYVPGRSVFRDFAVGDWIGLERPDFSAVDKVRVVAIAVQVNADGSETHELTLNSYIQWLDEQLTYIQTKLGGGLLSVAGTTAIASSITSQNAPTVFSLTLGSLGDVTSGGPGGNAPLVYDPVTGQWMPAGNNNAVTGNVPVSVGGTGGVVTIAGDGSAVTVSSPPAPPADGGAPVTPPANTQVGITSTTITDATGTTRQILGAQSDGTITSKDFNGPAPSAPDTPTVAGTLNGILVTWDGKLGGAVPLSDFLWTEVHLSTTSGFTPSSATLQGTIITASVFPVSGLTVGTTYYVKLMARNTSGVASAASAQASAVPTALNASAIGQMGVLNANPWFTGGDGTGWSGFNGTFTVTTSVPGTLGAAAAGQYVNNGTSAGAMEESGAPVPVSAGTNYLIQAWAYTTGTRLQIGFDWQTSSHGFVAGPTNPAQTVTANTWTLITAVETAPATAAFAVPRVGTDAADGATITAWGIIVMPQVPGALIQAGTVTAVQIAAGTITASNIASATITAAQIAAGTITGSNIAAGTVTASNIASGTITAGLLAAGIVKAGIIDGTSVAAQTYLCTGTSGEFLAYSGTPAAGNLINAIAGSTGTDSFANSWPQGFFGQQLTLQNQSSAPAAFSGASVLYSSIAGRLRYKSSAGADNCIPREDVNVSQFSMTTQTSDTVISAALSYQANEASQSSEYEIEIDGIIWGPTSGTGTPILTFGLAVDGTVLGASCTAGGVMWNTLNQTLSYTIRFRMAILTSGSGGTVIMASDGVLCNQGNNSGNGNNQFSPIGASSGGLTKSFDTTANHTLAVYAHWAPTTGTSGYKLTTYRTRVTRRM